jgi:hypothetical protein
LRRCIQEIRNIYLHYNKLFGRLPAELGRLPRLNRLLLRYNALTAGAYTHSSTYQLNLSRFRHKYTLDTPYYPRTSPITPPEEHLNASPIPHKLLRRAEKWTRVSPWLTGTLPPELGTTNNIKDLYLDGNAFTGSIPPVGPGFRV